MVKTMIVQLSQARGLLYESLNHALRMSQHYSTVLLPPVVHLMWAIHFVRASLHLSCCGDSG